MKIIILTLSAFMFFISCGTDESSVSCTLDQTITFYSNNSINICNDMFHEQLQGVDSEYGQFVSNDGSLIIRYDNGALAGNYIQETDTKTIANAINHEFWYTSRDSFFIVTFPIENLDPNWAFSSHNLISTNIDQKDMILDIARTFTVN